MATRVNLLSTVVKELKRSVERGSDDLELKMRELDQTLDKKMKFVKKELGKVEVHKAADSIQNSRLNLLEA